VLEGTRELRRGVRELVEEALPEKEQVVVVAGVPQPFALAVPVKDRDDLAFERREVRCVLGEDLREGARC
jgi:tRNA(Ser,Leu) C12 N-acetylase TAN1